MNIKSIQMKKILTFSAFLAILVVSCKINYSIENEGKGPIIDKEYKDLIFSGINQSNDINSEVIKSKENKIIVTAPDDIINDIIVESKNPNQISIYVKSNANISTKKVKVKIYMTDLNEINVSSSAEIKVLDTFTTKNLTLNSSSDGEILGNFKTLNLDLNSSSGSSITISSNSVESIINASSGSEIKIEGFTQNCDLNASSGSKIQASKFYSLESIAKASSGANIYHNVSKKLNANASSGGEISIKKLGTNIEMIKKESSGGRVSIN